MSLFYNSLRVLRQTFFLFLFTSHPAVQICSLHPYSLKSKAQEVVPFVLRPAAFSRALLPFSLLVPHTLLSLAVPLLYLLVPAKMKGFL